MKGGTVAREVQGKIELDIRDSKADWGAFLDTRALGERVGPAEPREAREIGVG